MRASTQRAVLLSAIVGAAIASTFCTKTPQVVPSVPVAQLPGHSQLAQDTAQKEELRLVPAEAYIRTYLSLFGGLAPLEVQKKARGGDGAQLFDTWDDYVGTLGLPDYRNDLPRGAQTNALMLATFERLGAALCDRAVEHDLHGKTVLKDRLIFAFEPTPKPPTPTEFAERFDVLHRTFLGYPASLAETDRTTRFRELYEQTVKRHEDPKAPKSRLSPSEAGWATVCEGLIRHPEFHLY